MNFSAAAKAQIAGAVVRADFLVELGFLSEIIRIRQNSIGPTQTLDGKIWRGFGGLGSIGALTQPVNGSAPSLTMKLSGVEPDFANRARGERNEYYNRPVVIYIQFFDEDWQCLDNPYALAFARMTTLKSSMKTDDDGTKTYDVTLTADSPFSGRRRPAYSYWTDQDQQLRYPGDKGLERAATINNKLIKFPAS